MIGEDERHPRADDQPLPRLGQGTMSVQALEFLQEDKGVDHHALR